MLNFREELGKIVEEKRKLILAEEEKKTELVDDALKDFLDKLKEKDFYKLSIPIKIHFGFWGKEIYVKEVNNDKSIEVLKLVYKDSFEANMILCLLEKRFKSEGYEIVDDTDALNGYFRVIIKT